MLWSPKKDLRAAALMVVEQARSSGDDAEVRKSRDAAEITCTVRTGVEK